SNRSGVAVLKMMVSISPGCTPAFCMAALAALAAMDLVLSPASEMWRSRIPVRSTIHSSDVSMPMAAKSVFFITLAGADRPVPVTLAIGREFIMTDAFLNGSVCLELTLLAQKEWRG